MLEMKNPDYVLKGSLILFVAVLYSIGLVVFPEVGFLFLLVIGNGALAITGVCIDAYGKAETMAFASVSFFALSALFHNLQPLSWLAPLGYIITILFSVATIYKLVQDYTSETES